MAEQAFTFQDFANPEFRPMRKRARAIYSDLIQTHAGPMPLDESPFTQEMIEVMLDARMMVRGLLRDFNTGPKNRAEAVSDLVYRQYIEHTALSTILNLIQPHFQFNPVAGIVGYHWHDDYDDEQECGGNDSYFINAGARIFDAENGVVPVVWSESLMCSWSHTEEVKRDIEHAKTRGEISEEEADEELRDAIESSDEFPIEGTYDDAYGNKLITFNIGEAAIKEEIEPIRIDTCMYDLFRQPQIKKGQFKRLLEPPEVVVSPMYRGDLCSVTYEANGAFTAMMQREWAGNDIIEWVKAQMYHLRAPVYRFWNGEDQ